MFSPREFVPGPRDPGSGALHKFPGRWGCVGSELLAHRILGGRGSSVNVSCPFLGSKLIAKAHAHL